MTSIEEKRPNIVSKGISEPAVTPSPWRASTSISRHEIKPRYKQIQNQTEPPSLPVYFLKKQSGNTNSDKRSGARDGEHARAAGRRARGRGIAGACRGVGRAGLAARTSLDAGGDSLGLGSERFVVGEGALGIRGPGERYVSLLVRLCNGLEHSGRQLTAH